MYIKPFFLLFSICLGRSGWTAITVGGVNKCYKYAESCGDPTQCTSSTSCPRGTCDFGAARDACKNEKKRKVFTYGNFNKPVKLLSLMSLLIF